MGPSVHSQYDKDKVDLEQVVMEDIWTLLRCAIICLLRSRVHCSFACVNCRTRESGLTREEAVERVGIFGHNRLEHKEQNPILQFL